MEINCFYLVFNLFFITFDTVLERERPYLISKQHIFNKLCR